ncbi:hypothetical protein PoB_005315400 [Plakobranchus ocellatus]|uniref:Uncharacterized protein n=1 Tax=Plakobranchus ocellatus TaxID=259542 RepID=A0AAV4C6H3_9GAST|nr:hypothetical protein PoB_005315400 [Plakobranchus ocellatus]
MGLDVGLGMGPGVGPGMGLGVGLGMGPGVGPGMGLGVGLGLGPVVGPGVGLGVGLGLEFGVEPEMGPPQVPAGKMGHRFSITPDPTDRDRLETEFLDLAAPRIEFVGIRCPSKSDDFPNVPVLCRCSEVV